VPRPRSSFSTKRPAIHGAGQVLAERDGKVWPGFEEQEEQEVIFELGLENCLLMLTLADGALPAGPTIWKAGACATPGGGGRSARVT
jgi:hypothetical protein